MIRHFSFSDIRELDQEFDDEQFVSAMNGARSILIQLYSASSMVNENVGLLKQLQQQFPKAIVVGATTVGEIVDGQCQTGCQVIGITCFDETDMTAISMPVEDNEYSVGKALGKQIQQEHPNTNGALILSTPLSIAAADLLLGLEHSKPEFAIFGGGAGDYASLNNSLVFCGQEVLEKGVVAVVFEGPSLHIDSRTYLGWRSLSRSMQITKANKMVVETIDDKPAFEVYRKYLDIPDDDNFFLNALEFPLLIERYDRLLARVPVGVTESGGLIFVADVETGESFRLGYGDPNLIVEDAKETLNQIEAFGPEVVFLYSCGCRRFLMQEEVDLETQPIEAIAPTYGFYTYGEFYSEQGKLPLLNSTLVAVSMREGEKSKASPAEEPIATDNSVLDPYANKHVRIVSRLVNFITATTAELERANDAKSQFLANTTHELRTPLTAIVGYAEAILNGDIENNKQLEAVGVIHRQSKNLISLINDILDISKIEARELEIELSECPILELVSELKSAFAHQAKLKHLSFDVDIEPNFPAVIKTDGARVRQILVNLCGNAIKFTTTGSIKIAIRYIQSTQAMSIEVTDTGKGMSKQQIQEVFTPFSQVKSQTDGKPEGTGLGLSISKELTQLLGGSLSVASELNSGTSFILEIPAPQIEYDHQMLSEDTVEAAVSGAGKAVRLLLADDSVENGALFKLFLENSGFYVDLVEDGTQALDKILANRYQLVLLDIQMPIMDGLETFELIRNCGIETPIIALTANALATDVKTYLEMGFCECIAKPVNKIDLVKAVVKHIDAQEELTTNEFDPKLFAELEAASRQSIKRDSYTINELIKHNDLASAQQLAHKMKGLSSQFGHETVARISAELERSTTIDEAKNLAHDLLEQAQSL